MIQPVLGWDGSVDMTQYNDPESVGRHPAPSGHTLRLRLKPKAPASGFVDGAWWPRSDDLAAELPDLLSVLSVRLGPIDRVLYKLGEWAKAPAKLAVADRSVRLDGYRHQPDHRIEVLGLNRDAIVLLVISPSTSPEDAHLAMLAAAGRDNASTVEQLLSGSRSRT
jgi:hypothetical protein